MTPLEPASCRRCVPGRPGGAGRPVWPVAWGMHGPQHASIGQATQQARVSGTPAGRLRGAAPVLGPQGVTLLAWPFSRPAGLPAQQHRPRRSARVEGCLGQSPSEFEAKRWSVRRERPETGIPPVDRWGASPLPRSVWGDAARAAPAAQRGRRGPLGPSFAALRRRFGGAVLTHGPRKVRVDGYTPGYCMRYL